MVLARMVAGREGAPFAHFEAVVFEVAGRAGGVGAETGGVVRGGETNRRAAGRLGSGEVVGWAAGVVGGGGGGVGWGGGADGGCFGVAGVEGEGFRDLGTDEEEGGDHGLWWVG